MKYLYVLFLLSAFHGFSQTPEEEVLKAIPAGVKILDQKFKVQYYGLFTKFNYITVKDSISGKTIVSKNTGQLDTYSELWEPFNGEFHIYFSETTVPPLLDSLEDGTYAMLYTAFPYSDGDTVKFKTNGVYALIPVKNYQVNGTVSWYLPNGKLAQKSEYVNGEKHGLTTFIQRNNSPGNRILFLEKKQYQSNIEEGQYYAEYHRITSKDPKSPNVKTFICNTTKKNGLHHGDFTIKTGNEIFISGEFDNGRPINHWIIKQWKIHRKKMILLPNMEFEINDDSTLVYSEFINRNLYSHELILKYPALSYHTYHQRIPKNYVNHLLRYIELSSLVEEWNTDRFYLGKNDFGSIDKIQAFTNCLNLLDKTHGNKRWEPDGRYGSILVDSIGKFYSLGEVYRKCGIYYDFKNFTCYYPNGQLHFSFDFIDTNNIVQQPVYTENGSKMNELVFSPKDGNYHYTEYESNGKAIYENVYDKNRKFISNIDFTEKKVVDGDTLIRRQKSNWEFYGRIKDSTENRNICLHKIIDYKTNQLIESHYYNPVTRKGRTYELELETGTSCTTDYEHDSLIQRGKLTETYSFKDLSISRSGAGDWNIHFIYDAYFITQFATGDLLRNGKPFNGDFRIETSEKQAVSSSFSKGTYSIILNKGTHLLLSRFILTIHRDLTINAEMDKDVYNWVPDSIQQKIHLKTISFRLQDGKAVGSIVKKSKTGYNLSHYYISNDSLVEYNNMDQWLRGAVDVYYGNYEEEFSKNWVSSISRYVDSGKIILDLNYNTRHDTVYYNYINKFTGVENYYRNEEFRTTRWNSLHDTILSYHFHNRYYGDSFEYNRAQQICREYWKDKKVLREFLLKDDQIYQINFYDTSGILTQESFLRNGYLSFSKDYYNGQLTVHRTYFPEDSVIHNLQGLPNELDEQIVRYSIDKKKFHGFTTRDMKKTGKRENFTRYQDEKVVEKGQLVDNRKSGVWNYSYPTRPDFQLIFRDTSYLHEVKSNYKTDSYTGMYTENKNTKPWKLGTFYEFDSEYNCGDNKYSEQYQIRYAIWNGEPTQGKSIRVVNYYPNGSKMNEGLLVNGKPEGLWLWYHNDGLLYQAGKYLNGMREGRWMQGDLSKVRFTGETCLDPTSKQYQEIIENIVVEIIYYKEGQVTNRESHQLNVGKE
ncbi:MAG: hypothetical protein ACO1N0_11905 [Fluviicola sp.]